MKVSGARAPVYTDVVQSSAGVLLYSFPLCFLLHLRIFCAYMYVRVGVPWCVRGQSWFSPFFHVGAGTLTQVAGLGSNCLYLLSHPHTYKISRPPYFSRQDLALDRELTDWLGCLAKELRGSALLR